MADRIGWLVTKEERRWLPIPERTAAVVAEVCDSSQEIEDFQKGTIEILIHAKFSNVQTTVTVRTVGKSKTIGKRTRRIE